MKRIALFVLAAVLAGCATTPDEEEDSLLASTALVKKPVETGDLIEVGRFSRLQAGGPWPEHWEPYRPQRSSAPTTYRPVDQAGTVVMEASAEGGYTGLQRLLHIDPRTHPLIEWSWRVPALDSDKAVTRPSPRARLMLAFHGDEKKLDFEQRSQLRLARAITGQALPYAALIYVWQNGTVPEAVVKSPYTDRVKLIAMDTGADKLDRWQTYRRNVLEDFRRAFGEEPGDIVGVGIFTDVDHNGANGLAWYGDITFRKAGTPVAQAGKDRPAKDDDRTTDSGKTCKQRSDCQGWCMAPHHSTEGAESDGECSETRKVSGCHLFVEKGRIVQRCVE